jgi:hypothetical protein
MTIAFSCPTCGRAYTVNETLACKRARCKQCGTEMRIPAPLEPVPAGPPPGTLYGLDEVDDAPDAALPPRAGTGTRTAAGPRRTATRPKRKRSDDGPWGLPLRWAGVGLLFVGHLLMKGLPAARALELGGRPLVLAELGLVGLGVLLTLLSVVGALVSFLQGNSGAFRGENAPSQVVWFGAAAAAVATTVGFASGYLNPGVARYATGAQKVPLEVYQGFVQRLFDGTNGFLDVLAQSQPGDDPQMIRARMQAAAAGMRDALAEATRTPLPTRDQARALDARYRAKFRELLVRYRDIPRAAAGRFAGQPQIAEAMRAAGDLGEKYLQALDASPDFYLALFGKDAGTGAALPLAGQPPAAAPPQVPDFVRQQQEAVRQQHEQTIADMQKRHADMLDHTRRASEPPPADMTPGLPPPTPGGPPGPRFGPPGRFPGPRGPFGPPGGR